MDDLSLDISEDLQNNLNFKDVDDTDEPKIAHHPPAGVGAYSDLKFEDDDDDLPVFKPGQDLPEYACKYCGIHDPASVVINYWTVSVGVKIRNLKVDFKTEGTWRRVRQ